MDRLTKYIDCYIPTETCNLKCHYCYIAQQNKFNNNIVKFDKKPEEIRKALSVKRLGGKCLFNFCAGGETLLSEEVLEVAKELVAEGHYIMLVTNGTISKRFKQVAEWPQEYKNRLAFKFSFHYLELLRLNMLDVFFSNIKLMHENGCSFTVEITPNDELIPYIEDVKKVCIEKLGTLCHITIARDDTTKEIRHLSKYEFDEFVEIWSDFKSELLDFKKTIFYKKRNEFCYAGDWSLYLNLKSGELKQCVYGNYLGNIYHNPEQRIPICAVGNNCEYPHCYNGHVFLTLGDIPELHTPTYLKVRDKIDSNQETWMRPLFSEFISQKLSDNNELYDLEKQKQVNKQNQTVKLKSFTHRIINKLKG